jgi:adenosylcobinamide-GDP ribazoletransferase
MAAPRQMELFLTATQFLTRVPVRATGDPQVRSLGGSLRYFPLVGGLVGLGNVVVWRLASLWFPGSVSVGLMLAASLLLTGGLHEDGLADSCDGLGGGSTRERTLEIMKDSRIGAFGALALIMSLGLKWVTLVALPVMGFSLVVVAAHLVSRWCSIGLIWALPYARADGDGKSGQFDGQLGGGDWLLSGLIGVAAVAAVAIGPGAAVATSLAGAAAAGLAAAIGSAILAAACFRRRIGGYTGDCLGAVQQLCELAFLLGALAVLRRVSA